ncbi:MAG: malonyl-CoA decarboxylase [Pseudolabrys sp.]
MSAFFGELMQTIARRGRGLLGRQRDAKALVDSDQKPLAELCADLISIRGEASGVALSARILRRYAALDDAGRLAFFEALVYRFGPDAHRLERAVRDWRAAPDHATASALHLAAEPRRLELLRRLNLAAGGTAALVAMRAELMALLPQHSDLRVVDQDFVHLFASWFNRGFLVLRRIDWSTSANILEKIIKYESVHEIRSWDDLRRRIDPPDRRCYAFFHPALIDEPLIFIEIALDTGIAGAIEPILSTERQRADADKLTTAIFYSISNCQRGLAGVSFGNFLIKQVVEEVIQDFPQLSTFVTLSPVPGFAAWLKQERSSDASACLSEADRNALATIDRPGWWQDNDASGQVEKSLCAAAAYYFLKARNRQGLPLDPVARFHLGNGARLEHIHFRADVSDKGLKQSHGIMVNYLYDREEIESNHEAFSVGRVIVASRMVKNLVPALSSREMTVQSN